MVKLDWTWVFWQIVLPLIGPIVLSGIFAVLWWSLAINFQPNFAVLVDLTPWALATYSLTLIGSTLRSFWPRFGQHPWLGGALLSIASADLIYYAFMVIRRHDPSFIVASPAYIVTSVLVAASIVSCYRAR